MTDTKDIAGTRADWLADKALRGLISTAMALPFERRVALMGGALRRAIGPLTGYRRRAEENLALIYPGLGVLDRRTLAEECCENFGRTLIENYSWQEFGERLRTTDAEGEGIAAVAEAVANKRPVIFVTGHFGNHEAPRHVLTRMGHTIGGLYRPMQNAYFNDHYAKTMTSWGGPVFAQGRRGTMGFVRHLRGGGLGTLLFDVSAPGAKLPFLGHPARTSLSAAEIALKIDAAVIPYFGIRQVDGLTFKVEVEAPIPHTDPETMLLDMNARLEGQIARNPAQWFWIHRRWKGGKKKT
ncbi:MAG: lysophospholipid acyltransferase family protein [Pseudomonadota bacterium]